MRHGRQHHSWLLALLTGLLPATSLAQALSPQMIAAMQANTPGGFSAETNLTQSFHYDSNPLRLPSGAQSIYGSTTSPELVLRFKSPTEIVESSSIVDANFFDHSSYNSVDVHQKLLLGRSNERWMASIGGTADYDTTRTSEFTTYGINLPKVRSTRLGITPEISYRLSARDALGVTSYARHVEYDNRAYTDYNYYQISPGYEHRFTSATSGSFALNLQRYETAIGADSASNSYGPSVGITHSVNPRLTLRGTAGALGTNQTGANNASGDANWNFVFSANADYQGARDHLTVGASRARAPFGNGTENLLNTFSLTDSHALNDRLALTATAKYQSAAYETPQTGTNLDEGYTLGGGIRYDMHNDLALTADYQYHNASLTNTANTVDEHVAMLGLSYRPSWSGK